jgi:SAM-dependent methyltransferase
MKYHEYINIQHYKLAREQNLSSRDEHYGGASFEERYRDNDIQALMERIALDPPAEVLVIGTGTGADSCWLADQGYTVTGIDIVQDAIDIAREIARKRGIHVAFYRDDICNICNAYGKFDVIIDSFCLQSIVLDDEREKVFAFVKTHLKKGAYYLIVSAGYSKNKDYDENYIRDEKTGIVFQIAEGSELALDDLVTIHGRLYLPVRRHHTLDTLVNELEGKGFKILDSYTEEEWGALKVIATT